ncbi:P-loop containing nucleoside triphosphate hydrolase protein [Cokeromyces recurvatus]|uniref:P-loop containing nucleoside triphosphate hydrolase protein n=1 Tax=Cokeromyces recurvatus TaxID=90255 RepID=UPI00221F8B2C|nr:P-loop containing nucleoside triphosphate hydrolase protein [Cokeromyces recurvatus]KAI7902225.1 P-loop containing nucleoside triphosphate hydrolase protein [Cokeromyces recurvatus]
MNTSLEIKAAQKDTNHTRVFLSLEVMQKNQIGTGDLIRIEKQDQIIFGIAWPSLTISAEAIELNTVLRLSGSFQIGDIVTIQKVFNSHIEATQINVQFISTPTYSLDRDFNIFLKEYLVELKFIAQSQFIDFIYSGNRSRIQIIDILSKNPSELYLITSNTKIHLTSTLIDDSEKKKHPPTAESVTFGYENIGGLSKQIAIIREMIETPLQNPELFLKYGLKPPRGVLLFGPPGTGKTLIARAVAHETGAHAIIVNGAEIVSKFYGETEQKLRDLFDEAISHAPSVIFIDEIDALCPKRDEAPSELEKRVVATLLTLMDGASTENNRVVVIGATNRPNALDEALRRPGRFDREVEIGIPTAEARLSIMKTILKKMPYRLSDEELESLANKAHGYVGADIAAVCREAGLKCIKRCAAYSLTSENQLVVNMQDMIEAMTEIRPSAMREIMLEVPKVYWSDIGGQSDIKQRLKESVEWPLQHPEAFVRLGIRPPKGILLYGPPGCSKTLMAKALATEAGSNFIAVKGPELFSKWVGESEKAVHEVFRKARAASPSIIFFDEIDALTVKRGSHGDGGTSVADRVLSQLLNELDGVEALVNVTVVAATNRPDIIDDALLRPGRIDRILYVGPPDFQSRKEIFRIQTSKMSIDNDVDLDKLAEKSEGCSGAEAVAICQEAALFAMEENIQIESVKMRHFQKALDTFTRRITPEMLQFYKDFQEKSGLQSI